MKLTKSFLQIFPLAIIFLGLLGYSYLNAAWNNPVGVAPNNNADAPVNVGTITQDKNGVLGLNALGLMSDNPKIHFTDDTEDSLGGQIRMDNNNLSFFADRNNDGVISGEGRTPLQLHYDANSVADYATFANQVRADEFCNRAGTVCASIEDLIPKEPITCDVTLARYINGPYDDMTITLTGNKGDMFAIGATWNNGGYQVEPSSLHFTYRNERQWELSGLGNAPARGSIGYWSPADYKIWQSNLESIDDAQSHVTIHAIKLENEPNGRENNRIYEYGGIVSIYANVKNCR